MGVKRGSLLRSFYQSIGWNGWKCEYYVVFPDEYYVKYGIMSCFLDASFSFFFGVVCLFLLLFYYYYFSHPEQNGIKYRARRRGIILSEDVISCMVLSRSNVGNWVV